METDRIWICDIQIMLNIYRLQSVFCLNRIIKKEIQEVKTSDCTIAILLKSNRGIIQEMKLNFRIFL